MKKHLLIFIGFFLFSAASVAEDLRLVDSSVYPIDTPNEMCLALNIYFEARNQTYKGMLAVGLVTLNRVAHSSFPDNVCDVVWQKRRNDKGRFVAQFSWTWDGKSDKPKNKKAWEISLLMASVLVAEGGTSIADFTNGATHYHAVYVSPYWIDYLALTMHVGDHIFYK